MSDLEREYSPSSRVGGSADPFLADYHLRSASVRDGGPVVREVAGGSLYVEASPGAPLLVFVHGGYWQMLTAADSLYLAPALRRHGWSCAALEYTLAPAASLARMVAECRAGLEAVVMATGATTVVLAGHSAGAHLAAMVALAAVPPVPLTRAVLVSGVYDLRPLVRTTVNDVLGLDETSAAALSPILRPVAGRPDTVVAWGDNETDAFKAQSRAFAGHLRAAGVAATELECRGRHHFDIVDDLALPGQPLGALTLAGAPPSAGHDAGSPTA